MKSKGELIDQRYKMLYLAIKDKQSGINYLRNLSQNCKVKEDLRFDDETKLIEKIKEVIEEIKSH